MSSVILDEMTAFAAESLMSDDKARIRQIVRSLARRWPEEPALGLCFALTSAASEIEDLLGRDPVRPEAHMGYRMAALVAADVLAVEAMGNRPAKARDLLWFWRRVDPYFLD